MSYIRYYTVIANQPRSSEKIFRKYVALWVSCSTQAAYCIGDNYGTDVEYIYMQTLLESKKVAMF